MAIDTIKSTAVLDGAIATADIADDNITTAKIADDAITSAKIDSASTGMALADLAVDSTTLVVNATDNMIGIGDSTPQHKLDIKEDGTTSGIRIQHGGSNSYATIRGPQNRNLRIDIEANGDADSLVVRDLRDGSERFYVNANGLVKAQSTNQLNLSDADDTCHLNLTMPSGGTAGRDALGPSIVLSKINSVQPMAAISSFQARADYPAFGGLSFHTHEAIAENDELVKKMMIWPDGRRTEMMGQLYRKTTVDGSSGFSNPDIIMFRVESNAANYSQYCFKAEVFGNGVSANKAQYISILGSGDFSNGGADGSAPNAPTITDITRDDIGGGVDGSYPTVTVSGNAVRITPDRQTNYDSYRVIVTVWGRSFRLLDGSGNDSDIHDLNYTT